MCCPRLAPASADLREGVSGNRRHLSLPLVVGAVLRTGVWNTEHRCDVADGALARSRMRHASLATRVAAVGLAASREGDRLRLRLSVLLREQSRLSDSGDRHACRRLLLGWL